MEDERDIVEFEDDNGNVMPMEVLDYFFYEGEEYALLADAEDEEPEECGDCERGECAQCPQQRDAFIMKVVPVGEDEEEFVPIDEALAETLIELVQNGFDNDDEDDEDDPDQE